MKTRGPAPWAWTTACAAGARARKGASSGGCLTRLVVTCTRPGGGGEGDVEGDRDADSEGDREDDGEGDDDDGVGMDAVTVPGSVLTTEAADDATVLVLPWMVLTRVALPVGLGGPGRPPAGPARAAAPVLELGKL